ncbi:hypothetical protein VTN02DRAFT_4534 [Thermoascus thermophilus]
MCAMHSEAHPKKKKNRSYIERTRCWRTSRRHLPLSTSLVEFVLPSALESLLVVTWLIGQATLLRWSSPS